MINPKRLVKMARKWQLVAAMGRRRISQTKADYVAGGSEEMASTGHFVVYSQDGSRFVVPLPYLNCPIFKELLKIAEGEFGLLANRPITLPCDGAFMEYIISMIRRQMPVEVEKALLAMVSITATCRTSSSSFLQRADANQQGLVIFGF